MEEVIFCPSCGTRIVHPERYCPTCQEPLPAPPTQLGFAQLPQHPPVAPTHPLPDISPLAFDKTFDAHGSSPEAAAPALPILADSAQASRDPAEKSTTKSGFPVGPAPFPGPTRGKTLSVNSNPSPATPPEEPPPPQAFEAHTPGLAFQSSTEPHPGPLPNAFDPPPPFVYGQPNQTEEQIAPLPQPPVKTKKRLPQVIVGTTLLLWSLSFGLITLALLVAHLVLLSNHGFDAMHESFFPSLAVSATALIPAFMTLLAGAFCLLGRGWPRVFASLGTMTHLLWGGITIGVVVVALPFDGMSKYVAIAYACSPIITTFLGIALLLIKKWFDPAKTT